MKKKRIRWSYRELQEAGCGMFKIWNRRSKGGRKTKFLGTNIEGKDVIVIDVMIASGSSILDTAKELKKRNAGHIIVCATFGLFTGGLKKFDDACQQGIIYKIISTNLTYQSADMLSRPYYVSADMSKFVALLIETLNHNTSINELLKPDKKIHQFLKNCR